MGCNWVRPARRLLEQSPVITPQFQRAQSLVMSSVLGLWAGAAVKRLKYFPNAPEEACQHCDCVTAFHDVPQSDLLVRKVILIRHGK
jgi:hypothetical protein